MGYIAPDDSPSGGSIINPNEDLSPTEQIENNFSGGGGDDDDDGPPVINQDYSDIIPEDELSNSESGMPGMGDPAADIISPDPNENTDGDEITINPDGSASVDTSRVSGGYESIDEIAEQVRATVGAESTPEVGEITALQTQVRDLREQLSGMGQIRSGSGRGSGRVVGPSSGTAVLAAVVATAVFAIVAAISRSDDQ